MRNVYRPNPKFQKSVSKVVRTRWARALRRAEKEGIKQARCRMHYGNQNGTFQCCLMVGLVEWGGNKNDHDGGAPHNDCDFALAIGNANPELTNDGLSAAELNDYEKLSFRKIADLIEGKTVTKE